jgi:hypothetical protein
MAGLEKFTEAGQAMMSKATATPTIASGYNAFRPSTNIEDDRNASVIAPRPNISATDILSGAMRPPPTLKPSAAIYGRGVGSLAMDAGYYNLLK